MNWGYQLKVSVYREGDPSKEELDRLTAAVNNAVPDAEFVGIAVKDIAERPIDQVGT